MTTASDTRIGGWAEGVLSIARAEDQLDVVTDELFQVARAIEGNDDLRRTLVDELIPIPRREAIVDDLLGGRGATRLTRSIVAFLVGSGRAAQIPEIVDAFVRLAAAERNRAVAEVRSAVPLDESQIARLATALSQATGREVEVRVIVDPTVLGGLVARVGDRIIDGSVRGRLEQLRATL